MENINKSINKLYKDWCKSEHVGCTERFKPKELMYDFIEFKKLCETKKLHEEELDWLNNWKLWDLACSPTSDDERRYIRLGHFLGWFSRKRKE